MIFQSTVRVNVGERYAAHVELDRVYRDRPREERGWHHAIIDTGPGGFWALLRTNQDDLVKASPAPEAWAAAKTIERGVSVDFLIQYAPKKVKGFSRFFESDEHATEQVQSRLEPLLEELEVELLSRQHISIAKRSNGYRAPSAFFRVTGRVLNAQTYEQFLCTGIGGSRAFGVGLPITPDSPLYELASALTLAEA